VRALVREGSAEYVPISLRLVPHLMVAGMQGLCHQMSSEDVYMRFFRRISALSYDEAQRLCNVDFAHGVAFVAVRGSREGEEIVAVGGYFLNPSTNLAETAFIVDPECQGTGLGTAL
jgi:hypothetical protein